ncbi:CHAT domain-containing protein [Nostoc sp. ATCC 53789]|uniref:CHAT domain-containing protein n=1 Tax=Nostoc sp. ATCC 53789 TaxID=76335 RepID=UPI000DEC2854|nr:CHAT domain-containing protein [Nostoc sp. ATCC 53789]QHG20410.1 CHAT domain-containing protein [Nostoc sp. ATCC 53789]
MARKRILFFYQLPTALKYLILGLCLTVVIVLCQVKAKSQTSTILEQSQAQLLNQQGFEELNKGQPQAALQTWQGAYNIYYKLKDSDGITGSLINQSLALQASGSYLSACQTLSKTLELEDWICSSPIELQEISQQAYLEKLKFTLEKQDFSRVRVIGLRNLGDVLRLIGNPEASSIILFNAMAIAKTIESKESDIYNQILLSLGNTERALYIQAKGKYQLTDDVFTKQKALKIASSKFQNALNFYQELASSKQNVLPMQAKINQLSLILEMQKWKNIGILENPITNEHLKTLLNKLLNNLDRFESFPAIESIYAQLNIAQSLVQIDQNIQLKQLFFSKKDNPLSISLKLANKANTLAQKLNNNRAESYALGTIATIYYSLGKTLEATQYFEKAMGLAQSVQAWDIAYEWQWQLGRLYRVLRKVNKANKVYESAINSLEQVRGNLLGVNPEIQFNFKDKVEPIYHEYMELLFSQDEVKSKRAVEIQEKLKLAEIENFLQCGRLNLSSSSNEQSPKELFPIIYLIKLRKQVEVVVRTPKNFYRHTVELKQIADPIDNLLKIVQQKQFIRTESVNYFIYSQTIYNLLFSPIKQYLPNSGSLGFVLDSYFQNLPIDMLHDGKKYLTDSYSIITASSSQQLQNNSAKFKISNILIGGISQPSPSLNDPSVPKNLPVLPEVKAEIENIKKSTASILTLIDSDFTSHSFQQKIEKNSFSLIHLSTHAQFSSDPEQTFVLTWDKPLHIKDLKFLLKNEGETINLLVLSACQTAKGDKRSALGIAGIAVQAGARSTLASLWLVDADSTALLMEEFYKGLKNGLALPEALRLAKLSLLSSEKYFHPYYWAGFILVGN